MKCPYCEEEFSDAVAEKHIENKWCQLNKKEEISKVPKVKSKTQKE